MTAAPERHKWLFRFLAVTLIPLLFFGSAELGLRLAGYGYPTRFFQKTRMGERVVLVENEKFGRRFFPPSLAREPRPLILAPEKPADTIRIFVFGESAAMGDPEPAYGFSRILEVLLRERFPGRRFEVVNVAMTAINSHAILPLARECARLQGDVWVIYMGNNEVEGPFGSGTIFGPQGARYVLHPRQPGLEDRANRAVARRSPKSSSGENGRAEIVGRHENVHGTPDSPGGPRYGDGLQAFSEQPGRHRASG